MTNNNIQDKCRENFEKWVKPFKYYEEGTVEANQMWQTFQAAYNLREQEVQRLRVALKFYSNEKEWFHNGEASNWRLLFNSSSIDGDGYEIAKQALQETTLRKKQQLLT